MADWQTLARRAARQEGVDPGLYLALVRAESAGRHNAVSPAGAIGYSQLMPATARGLGVDPRDPWQNLLGGARYLGQQLKAFGGDRRLALAAYNAGPGAVQKHGGVPPYKETQAYVQRILGSLGRGGSDSSASIEAPSRSASTAQTPSVDPAALLALLQPQQRQRAAGSSLPTPAALPDAYRSLSSGAPRARQDIGALAAMVQASPQTGAQEAAAAPLPASEGSPSGSGRSGGFRGSGIRELFWQGPGGINLKNGRPAPQGFVPGHDTHVHVAGGPNTMVALGKLAQSMGLAVRENPYFDPVDPVHVQGSNHYRTGRTKDGKLAGFAIDVSGGSAKQLAAFARRVAEYNRTRRL